MFAQLKRSKNEHCMKIMTNYEERRRREANDEKLSSRKVLFDHRFFTKLQKETSQETRKLLIIK